MNSCSPNQKLASQSCSQYNRTRNQRRIRAPAHGLLGDVSTQRRLSGKTNLLSLARTIMLRNKGDWAEVRVLAESQPDVVLEQTYSAVEEFGNVQIPIADYPPASSVQDDGDSSFSAGAWVDDDDDSDDSDSGDFGQMMGDGRRVVYRDYRSRRDCTNKTQRHWKEQMEPAISTYMEYLYDCLREVDSFDDSLPSFELTVIDLFDTTNRVVPHRGGFYSTSIIRAGLIPVAPLNHTVAFSTRAVRFYHGLFVRCPRLGKQPFVKTLCDLQGIPFKPHLATQLAAAFDTFVALKNGAKRRALEHLGRAHKNHRLLNTCPACQYRLKEDDALPTRMVVGMDGNDSLRRVERRGDAAEVEEVTSVGADEKEAAAARPSIERADARVDGGDYFLSPQEVNVWDEGNWETIPEAPQPENPFPVEQLWKEGECEERWHNASESKTARASGNFLECGWFVLLCRHMLLLLACDMIRSGEQFKYPLATLDRFMSAEKEDLEAVGETSPTGSLAVAYNINCKFSKTVSRSPLKTLAQLMWFLPVIGTMHGYAHQRNCQVLFLMLYIVGAGIEDGEFCERYFSVMNALAAITRHQSIFHRRQSISEVAYHHDNLESYPNISKFIYNNYKQALGIIATRPTLAREMVAQGIESSEVFYQWLAEEGEYLRSLTRTPPVETLEMEYSGKLQALSECVERLRVVRDSAWLTYTPEAPDETSSVETKHRHESENERKVLADLHALEVKLKIEKRWKEGDKNWLRVARMVKDAKYRRALDKLEGLLVAQIFEMAKLNVSGTGYKMRKHLAKAFKNRSKTIKTAITAYNEAADALSPPRPTISWEKLMEFSFLGKFDILQDSRNDVQTKRWATQKNRLLMQQFFKLIRAEEELRRLHQEIRRLLTYMAAEAVESTDPVLAMEIRELWLERGGFDDLHLQRLASIKKLKGFNCRNRKYFVVGTPVREVVDIVMEDGSEVLGGRDGVSGGDGGTQEASADDPAARELSSGPELVDGFDMEAVSDSDDEEEEALLAEKVQTILNITED